MRSLARLAATLRQVLSQIFFFTTTTPPLVGSPGSVFTTGVAHRRKKIATSTPTPTVTIANIYVSLALVGAPLERLHYRRCLYSVFTTTPPPPNAHATSLHFFFFFGLSVFNYRCCLYIPSGSYARGRCADTAGAPAGSGGHQPCGPYVRHRFADSSGAPRGGCGGECRRLW